MKQTLPTESEQQVRQLQTVANNRSATSEVQSFVDKRPQIIAQRQLINTLHASPRMIAQRKLAKSIHNSPRMVAQRELSRSLQFPSLQLQAIPEEEMLQGKFDTAQRIEEEELLQGKFNPVQRVEEDELLQGKFEATQLAEAPTEKQNNTGLPDNLKSGIESVSGISMDSVRVHYNSSQPAQLNALAYAQGTDIHVAPGQEQHLPHEAWHVVQQAQGRVTPTMQMKDGVPINDDKSLEHEADVMGKKAIYPAPDKANLSFTPLSDTSAKVTQRLTGVEMELHVPFYGDRKGNEASNKYFVAASVDPIGLTHLEKQKIADFIHGGLDYGESYGKQAGLYDISADHIGFAVNHAALKRYLVNQNYMENKDSESMTNIEYRSEPFEERDPRSQAKVDRAAAEIKVHAVDAAGKATSGQRRYLQTPVSNFYTGVPVTELNKLLNGDAPGLALVQGMVAAINPRIYLQTTTGTLPSEIPALFNEAAADMRLADITSVRAGLLENAILKAQQAVTANLGSVLMRGFNPGEIASLTGWMTLVAQYLLAYQLETSSYRFRVDGADGGKIKAGGSTAKNLVAYLSKTHLADTIDALPARARPNVNGGPRRADWIALFKSLLDDTAKNQFNLITALGLTDYEGQNYYDADGNNPAPIIHDEVLGEGQKPGVWMSRLLKKSKNLAGDYEAFHVQTGNDLTLDDGQENESPPLTIKGEQAIPLEDRYHKFKHSSGNLNNINRADKVIKNEWTKATTRRAASTAARTTFTAQLNAATAFLAGYGTAMGRVNTLLALRNEYNNVVADPDNVQAEQAKLNTLNLHIQQWQAVNNNAGIAYTLVSSLILDHRWSTKGSAFIGTKTPAGVVELRAVLNGNATSAQKLVSLAQIAVNKIASPDDRRHATTTLLYQLLRDMNGMYMNGGGGWTNFIARLTTVENSM